MIQCNAHNLCFAYPSQVGESTLYPHSLDARLGPVTGASVSDTMSLSLTSLPLSHDKLREGINMLRSEPLSFGHSLHCPDSIIYSDLGCVCTRVCGTKVSFESTCTFPRLHLVAQYTQTSTVYHSTCKIPVLGKRELLLAFAGRD